ncbi:MAG TPA: sigma-54 dependent transcriptional regulator [Longimicrobiales bacterium]|nr:sigma-54 dependent transcriptional regulator [Longimicrobiales bacterium]
MSRSILLVDDDSEVLNLLSKFFEREGWQVARAADAKTCADLYERDRHDVIVLDLDLPGLSGLKLLEVLRTRDPDATVIMLTGHGDIATAVEAMQLGAENFLTKPVELAHMAAAAERAYEKVELRRRNRYWTERQSGNTDLAAMGRSAKMREIARQIELLSKSDTTVLLLGETGTGKGWAAHLIHSLSTRAAAPMVEINCAGLSATFLDSELFGHEKGAFTDAKEQKRGLFELAHTGTIFLDEIGDLSPELQPKLLKVLESRRFRRLGGNREIEVDVRLIAATNHDLATQAKEGKFREDLYYRLSVLPLQLPPLRQRGKDDIADLAVRILLDLRRRIGRGASSFSAEAMAVVTQYPWPGNIRELRNVLERALIMAPDSEQLLPANLPLEIMNLSSADAAVSDADQPLEEIEKRHIARVLAHNSGNRSKAARVLGISRATLYEKLHKYGLD